MKPLLKRILRETSVNSSVNTQLFCRRGMISLRIYFGNYVKDSFRSRNVYNPVHPKILKILVQTMCPLTMTATVTMKFS